MGLNVNQKSIWDIWNDTLSQFVERCHSVADITVVRQAEYNLYNTYQTTL